MVGWNPNTATSGIANSSTAIVVVVVVVAVVRTTNIDPVVGCSRVTQNYTIVAVVGFSFQSVPVHFV